MMSNCALMALTAPSSGRRCSASTPCNAEPRVVEAVVDLHQAAADLDQREREHEDDDGGEDDAHQDHAHLPPKPSVSAFM